MPTCVEVIHAGDGLRDFIYQDLLTGRKPSSTSIAGMTVDMKHHPGLNVGEVL